MSRVLIRQLLVEGTGHHLPHFVPELLNLGEGSLDGRAVRPEAANCHRGDTLLELLLRLIREYGLLSSVLAHATFLPKQANLPNQ
jgi:hypothetical protein